MTFENMKEAVEALANAGVSPEGSRMQTVIVRGYGYDQYLSGATHHYLIVSAPGKENSYTLSKAPKEDDSDNYVQNIVNEGLLNGSLMKLQTTKAVHEKYTAIFGPGTLMLVNQPARIMIDEHNKVLGAWPSPVNWQENKQEQQKEKTQKPVKERQ